MQWFTQPESINRTYGGSACRVNSDSAISNWQHTADLSNARKCCWSSYSMKTWTICSVWTRPRTALKYRICQISLTAFPATSCRKLTGFPWCWNHSYQSEWHITCVSRQVTCLPSHSHLYFEILETLQHFRTLSGRFCTLGIISLWTRLGASTLILVLWQNAGQCIRSFSSYFKIFSLDWLSFSLDIDILAVPAYRHLPAFIAAPGSLRCLSGHFHSGLLHL